MLNAAYEEFAEYGYEHASTNRIVKKAGIGKGMLFYYFNSKKELFNYLFDYGIDFIIKEYIEKLDENETDFIERYRHASQIKLKVYHKNPHVFNFLATFYIKEEVGLSEEMKKRIENLKKFGFSKMFSNIDQSLFRDDLKPEQVMKLIYLTIIGYEKELINRLKGEETSSSDMQPHWDDFHEFLDALKKVYYK
ncbi:MAG: TetR/AcrR family transcriptional regulator [Caldicoprobacterales bacterium]